MCNECNQPLGSNDFCPNCIDCQNYAADDYFADQDAQKWEAILDHLWDLQFS